MSTTVTYKGNTIATVDNNTKTLTTQGKYLEGNIILTDVSGGGGGTYQSKSVTYTPSGTQQTATISPDAGYDALSSVGITVNAIAPPYYDMSGENAWLGAGAEIIATDFYSKVDTLNNTTYPSWTPSSTAQVIVSTQTLSDAKFTATDLDEYAYYIEYWCGVDIVYTGSPTQKALPLLGRSAMISEIGRRPGSWTAIGSNTFATNTNMNFPAYSFLRYYGTTTGTVTYTWTASYGLYFGMPTHTISNTTADSPVITPKTPTLSARTSTTYMSTTNAGLIDQANTKFWILGKYIYRVKRDGILDGYYKRQVKCINATPPDLPTP